MNIKKCPFCGSTPEFPEAKNVFGTYYECGCNECGIPVMSLQIIDFFDYPRDAVHDSWDAEESRYGLKYIDKVRTEAIEMWNNRAEDKA